LFYPRREEEDNVALEQVKPVLPRRRRKEFPPYLLRWKTNWDFDFKRRRFQARRL
jgi:hypothetical protein